MKIGNIYLFTALFALIVLITFLQKFLSDKYLNAMSQALGNMDFDTFDRYADSFLSRLLFSPFNLNYLKLNAAFLKDDKERTDEVIRNFELIDMNAIQKEDVYLRVFNYYMAEENYEKAKMYLERIENSSRNEGLITQSRMVYDIYALKSTDHLDELLKKTEEMETEQRGYAEMLISETYKNMDDQKNAKKYKDLSIHHFRMLEEKIRKEGIKNG